MPRWPRTGWPPGHDHLLERPSPRRWWLAGLGHGRVGTRARKYDRPGERKLQSFDHAGLDVRRPVLPAGRKAAISIVADDGDGEPFRRQRHDDSDGDARGSLRGLLSTPLEARNALSDRRCVPCPHSSVVLAVSIRTASAIRRASKGPARLASGKVSSRSCRRFPLGTPRPRPCPLRAPRAEVSILAVSVAWCRP